MAVVQRFALDLARIDPRTGSVEAKRKSAGRASAFPRDILGLERASTRSPSPAPTAASVPAMIVSAVTAPVPDAAGASP